MTQATHTPGPWYYAEWQHSGGTKFYIAQQDGAPYTENFSDTAEVICDTVSGEKYDLQKANATLIAAAPDLLEALQALVQYAEDCDDDSQVVDRARDAIAKATGASCAN